MPALLVRPVPHAKASSKQQPIKSPAGPSFMRDSRAARCYHAPSRPEKPMKTIPALMIALCLLAAPICRSEDDVAKARKELQAAVDAAVKQHPELDDMKAFVASRIKGRNGWPSYMKLVNEWADVLGAEGSDEWADYFQHVRDPHPGAHGDKQRDWLAHGLSRSAPIARAAEKLLEFDSIICDPVDPLNFETSLPTFRLISLTRCLNSRAVAMAVLGKSREEIVAAALLSYRVAMKVEMGIHLTGCLLTTGMRAETADRVLAVYETLPNRVELLEQLLAIKPARTLGPRDWWIGENAYIVGQAKRMLKQTDKELESESERYLGMYSSAHEMLAAVKRQILHGPKLIAKFPPGATLVDPAHAEPLIKAAQAAEEDSDENLAAVDLLVAQELAGAVWPLIVRIRVYEDRNGHFPDDETFKQLLKESPGFAVRRTDSGLEVDAAADHPVRRLSDKKLLLLPIELKRWAKQ
jgi:hypothetical protein